MLVNSGPQVTNYSGSLITAGAVVLDAGTVYPSTGVNFTIETAGAVTFQNSAGVAAIAPISVGGSLSVEASSITVGTATPAGASQGPQPTIVAPYGQINLGALSSPTAGDPYFATTSTLTVESGAVVTVSGAGQILPYGETQDLQTWLFGQLGALSAAPAKAINIDAATATIASGAKIDLSGGGDIYAYEFITGLGGTNDVLSAAPTSGFSASSPSKGVVTFSGSAIANAPVTFSIALPNGTSTTLTTTNGDTPATLAGRVAALIAAEGLKATVSGGTVSITGTLSATLTGYSGTVYAIDPNLKANSAPVDIYGYADTKNLNDPAVNAIGKTLTLTQPAAGLAAGTYLLLPVCVCQPAWRGPCRSIVRDRWSQRHRHADGARWHRQRGGDSGLRRFRRDCERQPRQRAGGRRPPDRAGLGAVFTDQHHHRQCFLRRAGGGERHLYSALARGCGSAVG